MATFRRFEDIKAWQKARKLAADMFKLASSPGLARSRVLRDHMTKSALSIVSNIAEGHERGGSAEFAQFLSVAKGSTGELRAQLYVALDAGCLSRDEFERMRTLTLEIAAMLTSLARYLRQSDLKGTKFRQDRPGRP